MIQNGSDVVDTVSGFAGKITATTYYLDGRVQYCVEGKVDGNGEWPTQWFYPARLELKPEAPQLGFGGT